MQFSDLVLVKFRKADSNAKLAIQPQRALESSVPRTPVLPPPPPPDAMPGSVCPLELGSHAGKQPVDLALSGRDVLSKYY